MCQDIGYGTGGRSRIIPNIMPELVENEITLI